MSEAEFNNYISRKVYEEVLSAAEQKVAALDSLYEALEILSPDQRAQVIALADQLIKAKGKREE